VLLFLTMLIMAISALRSWLRGWTLTIIVVFIAILNGAHHKLTWFRNPTAAYGLNYNAPPAVYDPYAVAYDSLTVKNDIAHTEAILSKRLHIATGDSMHKPKLVILNHSGGGTRSAYWTMRSIPYADSVCNGALLKNTVLMTGASGGMVGAAYLRELMVQANTGRMNLLDPEYANNMAKDLLNPIMLAATTGDWFIRYRRLDDGNYTYSKDRATALEEQLHRNTQGAFDKRLKDYIIPEAEGNIPMIILTPTIANDGRRLVIGAQPLSYLCDDEWKGDRTGAMLNENIEFNRLFVAHDASNLRLSSALRMNASFPYVTPMATLPTNPAIEVFDAGIRDNFGWKTTARFILALRTWIEANTSGVIIVQVRDLPRDKDLSEHAPSLFGKFSAPLGGIYGNLTRTQDYAGNEELQLLSAALNVPVEAIQFQLEQTRQSQISLSWHLTRSEKDYIHKAVHEPYFTAELVRLKKLLETN
jgi:hypothetical protein